MAHLLDRIVNSPPKPPYLQVEVVKLVIGPDSTVKLFSRLFKSNPVVFVKLWREGRSVASAKVQLSRLSKTNMYLERAHNQVCYFADAFRGDNIVFQVLARNSRSAELVGEVAARVEDVFLFGTSTDVILDLGRPPLSGLNASITVRLRYIAPPDHRSHDLPALPSPARTWLKIQPQPGESREVNDLRSVPQAKDSVESFHLATPLQGVNGKVGCSHCEVRLTKKESLFEHMVAHHEVFNAWIYKDPHLSGCTIRCPTCTDTFQSTASLALHLSQRHSVGWIYTDCQLSDDLARCPRCKSAFQSTGNLAWHMKQTHGIEMFQRCLLCDKETAFVDDKSLISHVRTTHPEIRDVEHKDTPLTFRRCSACDKVFPSEERVRQHERERHGIDSSGVQTRGTPEERLSGYLSESSRRSTGGSSVLADQLSNRSLISVPEESGSEAYETRNQGTTLRESSHFTPTQSDPLTTITPSALDQPNGHRYVEQDNPLGISNLQKPPHELRSTREEFGGASRDVPAQASTIEEGSSTPPLMPESSPGTIPNEWSAHVSLRSSTPTDDAVPDDRAPEAPPVSNLLAQDELPSRATELVLAHENRLPAGTAIRTPVFPVEGSRTSGLNPRIRPRNGMFDILNARLSSFFSPIARGPKNGFSDAEIQEISSLLSLIECTWSRIPRTYIILRIIGHSHLIEELLDLGFNDYWFPVSLRNLPQTQSLTPLIRSAIVDKQYLIFTKSIDLEKGENGRHRHFKRGDVLPFQDGDILGTGTYGRVDKVLSLISYKHYARKRVYRQHAFANKSRNLIGDFIREVHLLKHMKHRHVVELTGSYTDPTYFAIIMSPVADMDFSKYLETCQKDSFHTLRTYFGCLATALQYLHSNNIRHKDIKPQNILIHSSNILFTDFGLSRDTTGAESASSGFTGYTPRYCAPEITESDSRSYPSDIWSLGCVFLEMLVVLKGKGLPWMRDDFFANHGNNQTFVRTNTGATVQLLATLEGMESPIDNVVIQWVQDMTQRSPGSRPSAATLVDEITRPDPHGKVSLWCGLCCAHDEESAEEGADSLSDDFFGHMGDSRSEGYAEWSTGG